MSNAVTIIPATYPELEAETYASLDFPTERTTLVPSAEEQSGLQVDCLLGDSDGQLAYCERCRSNNGKRCGICSDPRIKYSRLDRDPVEIEVDAMFWEQNEAAITAADMREGLTFRLSQRDE
jgi:hypothetical protein